jgi:FixJ family two-component response regulator
MICVVDDDPLVRSATVDLLNSLGHSALAFNSAEEFLDSGLVDEAACLILDLQLPGLSGLELQTHLLTFGPQPPIVFISAFADQQCRERALHAGAVAFLTKPYGETEFLGALETALSYAKAE